MSSEVKIVTLPQYLVKRWLSFLQNVEYGSRCHIKRKTSKAMVVVLP